jgi:hypothetical protein
MKRFLLGLAGAAALWTASCGGGGSVATPPPPVGGFTNASLKGQFAFVTNGEVINTSGTETPLARTGSFIADGNGNITSGVEDVVAPNAAPNLDITITGGTYTINADGRGTLALNVTSGGVSSTINFGIVLTSANNGLLMDETSTSSQASTGSGNFFPQNTTAFTNPVLPTTATYVFDFSGEDVNMAPDSFVGEFTAGNGAITAGFEDVNADFALSNGAIPPGALTADLADTGSLLTFGRGVATIAGESYVFYIVDSTRIRFISTSGGAMFSGDAVIQDNTIPTTASSINSGFAYVVAGSSSVGVGLTRVGRFTANAGNLTNIEVDTNNGGTFTSTTGATIANIVLDPAHLGRGTISISGNGLSIPLTFVFYLSSAKQGVIQETTMSAGIPIAVADGTVAQQSGAPFSASNITGTYAINWSGQSIQNGFTDEEDLAGQVKVSNLNLTGAADIFQFTAGAAQTNVVTSGIIAITGDGTGSPASATRNTMQIKVTSSSSTTVNFVVYFVNPQLAFIANNQGSSRVVAGVLKAQQTP